MHDRPITDFFNLSNGPSAKRAKTTKPRPRPLTTKASAPSRPSFPVLGSSSASTSTAHNSSSSSSSTSQTTFSYRPPTSSSRPPGSSSQKRVSTLVVHIPSDEDSVTEPETDSDSELHRKTPPPPPRSRFVEPSSLVSSTPSQSQRSSQRNWDVNDAIANPDAPLDSTSPSGSDTIHQGSFPPEMSLSPVPSSQTQLMGEESPIQPRQKQWKGKQKQKAKARSPSPTSSDYNASVGSSQSQYLDSNEGLWSSPVRPPNPRTPTAETELEVIPSSQPDEIEITWPLPNSPVARTPTKPKYDPFRFVRKRRFQEAFDPTQSSPPGPGEIQQPAFSANNNSPPQRNGSPTTSVDNDTPVRPPRRQVLPEDRPAPNAFYSSPTPSPVKAVRGMINLDTDEELSYPPDFPMSLRF